MTAIPRVRHLGTNEDVDGRDQPGHDEVKLADSIGGGR
jgi:hypothetical protein